MKFHRKTKLVFLRISFQVEVLNEKITASFDAKFIMVIVLTRAFLATHVYVGILSIIFEIGLSNQMHLI